MLKKTIIQKKPCSCACKTSALRLYPSLSKGVGETSKQDPEGKENNQNKTVTGSKPNTANNSSNYELEKNPCPRAWNVRYLCIISLIALAWLFAYSQILTFSHWLTYNFWGLENGSSLGAAVQFFLYDTVKILLLLLAMIYLIAWLRASLNLDKIRTFLAGKGRAAGYVLGAGFGAVTPFCSCSSIPFFLGFCSARIPIGVSMAFIITSSLFYEVGIVLLWGILGWKFTVVYVLVGVLAGIGGGILMDTIKAQRWLTPLVQKSMHKADAMCATDAGAETYKTPENFEHSGNSGNSGSRENLEYRENLQDMQELENAKNSSKIRLSLKERHLFAWFETSLILKKIWIWVVIGVGTGAALHGYVPENWFAQNLGSGQWWSVPAAVGLGIPLYSNVTGIVPIMQSLLAKGLPIGTTLAFCMSTVAASLPEILMLKQVMQWKMLAVFLAYLLLLFTLLGWFFNLAGSYLFY